MKHSRYPQLVMLLLLVFSLGMAQSPTLRVLSFSVEQADLFRELEAAFNARYPQWTVRFDTMSQDSFKQTLPLSFETGDAPDIIMNALDLPQSDLLANGWLAPVAGGAEIPAEWFARFPENAFIEGHNLHNGLVYGTPLSEQDIWGPGYMYYNRTVLSAAGIDPDSEVPTTWSELLAVCERVIAADLDCFSASFNAPAQVQRWWIPFSSVVQGWSSMNFQTGRFSYGDEARLRAWELLRTMYNSEYFIPGVETTDRETSRQIFALDQAAFYMDGPWMPSVFRSGMGFADLDFGVAPTPVPDGVPAGAFHKGLLPSRLFVTSQVRNAEAAWAFVDFITDPEGPYAVGYVGGGFGFLAFADNAALIDPNDAVLQRAVEIGSSGYRVYAPVPLLACPSMAASTAFRDAERDTAFAQEEPSIVEALVTGRDWAVTAREMAAGRQLIFEANMAREQAQGIGVHSEFFTFPDWDFVSDFDYSLFPHPLCEAN